MKVLIITYYWPPAGGSGVQRWLKFTKYLPKFGVTPVVYTVKNAKYPNTDISLLDEVKGVEVLQKSIFNPVDLLPSAKKQSGVTSVNKKGLLSWIRGNFFIPDPKFFWIKPSVKYLSKYLQENNIDAVITSGPPHSMHLIGLKLKKRLNTKWIADFRDPWSNLYYQEDFNLSSFAKSKNIRLEKKVLKKADKILTVSNTLREELPIDNDKIEVITNGFDDDIFIEEEIKPSTKFRISYIGLLPKQSNPILLWKVLNEIISENVSFKTDFELSLTGDICPEAKKSIQKNELLSYTNYNGYVTHKEAVIQQKEAQVLLLLIPNTNKAKGIITGKVFEYLQSNRPILAIGPEDGDLATILNETKVGVVVDFSAKEKLKKTILNYYKEYQNNNLKVSAINTQKYHRKTLTKQLVNVLKETINL